MNLRCSVLVIGLLWGWAYAGQCCAAENSSLVSGIDRATFDTSIKPGENFYQYVNGEWIKQNPIPAEYSRWGAFMKLRDDNLIILHDILEGLSPTEPLSGERQQLRDFYRTAMDVAKRDEQGAKPLEGRLARIEKIASAADLVQLLGELRAEGSSQLFGLFVDQDEKRSTHYAVYIHQGGQGLPERDYYLGKSEDSEKIRAQYLEHVAKILMLLGDGEEAARAGAETVLKIETQLAEGSRTPVELRDREANYNKESLAELAKLVPNLDWQKYLIATGIPDTQDIIVGQPEFLTKLNELLSSVPVADWKVYLRWHVAHSLAPHLSSVFENENFRFYNQVLRGAKEMQPQWKRAVAAVDGNLGEQLGKLYVEKYFVPAAKERMDQLVKNLMLAYHERIETRDWMGSETKQKALAKLATVVPKIGYPTKWRDFSGLEIKNDGFAANVLRAREFESRYRFSKLGGPVDRLEWHMTPPTVNAYYNPSLNEIVFPAGILQPPFFNLAADDAVNYGGIGAVIGHEISHGFDDQGSRSDAEGNLVNWWTDEDRAKFTAKTDKLVAQYEACALLDDLHVNGKLTLGENIADLGGVTIAYAAYQKSLGGKPAPVIDGFTGAQRFFIGFAQVWRGNIRDADQRLLLRTDPHSPGQFRTLVPLSNVPAFYEAFGVQPGEKLYRAPAERAEIW
jgi:putative endopeptidase